MKAGLSFQVWIVTGVLGAIASVVNVAPAGAQSMPIEPAVPETSSPIGASDSLNSVPAADWGAEVAPLAEGDSPLEGLGDRPATTIQEWVAQIETTVTQITDVRVEATEAGLQVILETADGALAVPETRTVGNALIADIANAAIAEEVFEAEPIAGIALVEVVGLPDDRVRVSITGTDAPPVAEVRLSDQGLVLGVAIGQAGTGAEDEAIQVVVTGEQDEGYNPSSASTATRTDTPLRDIPQSIQVVPRQVLEDRNVRTVNEAIETVSGVIDGGDSIFRIFRGFSTDATSQLRNGYRIGDTYSLVPEEPTVAIERVEVLKGPGSVLFGALEPGGVINTITRQPLSQPYYSLAFEAGNYGFYQPSIDLSGPLTTDETVLYRFIAAYSNADGYFEGGGRNNTLIAPSITLNFGNRTSLNLYYQYSRYRGDLYGGLSTVALSDGSLVPQGVNVWGNPDLTFDNRQSHQYGFELEHNFNDNLQLRSALSANNFSVPEQRFAVPIGINDDRFVDLLYLDRNGSNDVYFGQIDLLGRFNTGSISHQLLVGFDYESAFEEFESFTSRTPLPPLDLRDPDYDVARPTDLIRDGRFDWQTQSYGVYIQDQIAFSDNLKLLIGGRYDWISDEFENLINDADEPEQNDGAFSPRIGLVYQPSDTVSLYASYSRSFRQATAFSANEAFEPTRGTQSEIGTRVDFLEGRLSANLAAYHLTRTNITTPDPDNPGFSVQTGEARSQGIELDVTGEILPGWNVILSYAYTDAEVTEDNVTPVGNQLASVPFNQASLWTTYEIQQGDLEGLGFGLGLFYISERQGDLANSFTLDSYLRTDAALYYRRGGLRAAINVRNLFDIDYVSFASANTNVQRGAPFTIVGSLSWEF
jgi:iron complex outermembrane receptor protein